MRHLPCWTASRMARKYCGPSRNSCMIHTQTALDCSTLSLAAVSRTPSHSALVADDRLIFPHLHGREIVYRLRRTKSNSNILYALHYHVALMAKRSIRSAIEVVAVIAGAVFLIVNPRDLISFFILIGSIAVLFVCLLLWELLFSNEHTGQPDKPEQ